jgi:hypothetical protein
MFGISLSRDIVLGVHIIIKRKLLITDRFCPKGNGDARISVKVQQRIEVASQMRLSKEKNPAWETGG